MSSPGTIGPRPDRTQAVVPTQPSAESIAIVGMSCRFPGARGVQAFWRLLRDGLDAITEVPSERWDADAFYDPDPSVPGKALTRWGGFLDRLEEFDAPFFGISPREAAHLDPRQRIMLELAWEALEDAGIPPHSLAGSSTGVFIATLTDDYGELVFERPEIIEAHSGPGGAHSVIANRISYFLDLRGPSLTLDTACSGSLVAIHTACQSLRGGETSLALVGGVSLNLKPGPNIFFSKAGAIAADGRCKTFDARADGMVRSDGAGLLVLKRLADALADGDPVHAVIRGSAVNSDGRSNGLMAPSEAAQEMVLREAYRRAGIDPAMVQYIEAHGTGTRLGDPIEVQAAHAVVGQGRRPGSICALGSVKTNVGHMEAAAGVAGVIKVALAMRHRQLPPSLHFREPNPLIPFAEIPLRVQSELGGWPQPDEPLVAGVSGFGVGGTNAHVVLEALPAPAPSTSPIEESGEPCLVPLSAGSPEALAALAAACLEEGREEHIAAIAATAALRRSHLDYRLAVVARSRDELSEKLRAYLDHQPRPGVAASAKPCRVRPRVVFAFSGQGTHWPGMGLGLREREPVFRSALEEIAEELRALTGWSLLDRLRGGEAELASTDVAQPAIFAVQVALARLWYSWGIEPAAVAGQSLGEVAAAHVAGALGLADACRVVVHRSRLMRTVEGRGKTAVVELPFEQAELVLTGFEDELSVAGSTSPTTTVISGEPGALTRLIHSLERRGIFGRLLKGVEVAFHGLQMEPLREELEAELRGLQPRAASVPLYSSVTAGEVTGTELDAGYWGRNLCEPFHFAEAVEALSRTGPEVFLEIGPHAVLAQAIEKVLRHAGTGGVAVASLRREHDERESLLAAAGALYAAGCLPDWSRLAASGGLRAELPSYPWQREAYWFDGSRAQRAGARKSGGSHPLLGPGLASAVAAGQRYWEMDLGAASLPYLRDHRFLDSVLLPGSAFVEMAFAAAEEVWGAQPVQLSSFRFDRRLDLRDGSFQRIQVAWSGEAGGEAAVQVFSSPLPLAGWTRHAGGRIRPLPAGAEPPAAISVEAVRARCTKEISQRQHYETMLVRGLEYGPRFRAIHETWRRDGEAIARLVVPEALHGAAQPYRVHPVLLDAALQIMSATVETRHMILPAAIERIVLWGRPGLQAWCRAVRRSGGEPDAVTLVGDIQILDDEGRITAELIGVRLTAESDPDSWLYELSWVVRPRSAAAGKSGRAQGTWLVLADGSEVGTDLGERLEAYGDSCLLVFPGEEYRFSLVERMARIAPDRAGDYERLLREVGESGSPCVGIVHLWSLDAETPGDAVRGCRSVLHLAQSLARHAWQPQPRLWLVTRGAQPAGEEVGEAGLLQSPLWGMGRVLALEHPELWGGLIDLRARGGNGAGPAAGLFEEIWESEGGGEDQVALRGALRHVARLVPRREAELPARAFQLRPDGAYLVTGGLGGLGLEVARWLVGRGARRLILVGRTEVPPRSSWSEVPAGSPAAGRIAAIRSLEALGASVRAASFDVADEGRLASFLAEYRSEGWPPIRGVVHSAGLLRDSLLTGMNEDALSAVLRPKIHGAWALHQLLQQEDLDFFVLFSSISAVLGNVGQANYAAGNAFLGALAHHRQAAGLPALCIDWGPWSEVGMATVLDAAVLSRLGLGAIAPEQGLDLLGRLMGRAAPQVAVIPAEARRLAKAPGLAGRPILAELLSKESAAGAAGGPVAEPKPYLLVLEGDLEQLRERVQERLQTVVAGVLGLDAATLDPWQPLTALGMDSIMGAELKNRLDTELRVSIPLVTLFRGLSVVQLAAELIAQISAASPSAGAAAKPKGETIIESVERGGDLPLSFAQQRHWFLHQLDPESPMLNQGGAVRLSGRPDVAALERSVNEIVRRHEVLRTRFPDSPEDYPRQEILEHARIALPLIDLSGLPLECREEEAQHLLWRAARHPFDLAQAPLLRMILVRLDEAEHLAFVGLHHIVADGQSVLLFVRELGELYAALSQGRPSPLSELKVQYLDYAAWQRRRFQQGELQSDLIYWKRQLAGAPAGLALPFDHARPESPTFRGERHPLSFPEPVVQGLNNLARRQDATLFMTLLSALYVLLHRYSGQDDLVVGTPVANRNHIEIEPLIGCFINALALRADLAGDPTFSELLDRVREMVLEAFDRQELPFDKLVEELNPERSPGRLPVFQVVLNLQNVPPQSGQLGSMEFTQLDVERGMPVKYDLVLYVNKEGEGLTGSLAYSRDVFAPSTIAAMAAWFEVFLAHLVLQPEARLSALERLIDIEGRKVMEEQTAMREGKLKKLAGARRKAIDLAEPELVRTGYLDEGSRLPLVITPSAAGVDLLGWVSAHGERIESELHRDGAILFRGFDLPTVGDFERVALAVTPELVNYMEGSSPRIMLSDKVYTSTEYPPEFFVSLHNELSYAHRWPSKIFFFCALAPAQGGETPIADSRKVLERIPEPIREEFMRKGVRYLRWLHGGRGAGLAWQTVFETEDRAVVESYCREGKIDFEWTPDGGLRTSQVRPAVIRHPRTGELLWFNQADQFHPSNLPPEIARSLLAVSGEDGLPINATFGDGSPMDGAVLDEVRAAFRETMVAFPWQKGDLLVADNMLVAHGRMPFAGPRRVVVAMGAPVSLSEVEAVGTKPYVAA